MRWPLAPEPCGQPQHLGPRRLQAPRAVILADLLADHPEVLASLASALGMSRTAGMVRHVPEAVAGKFLPSADTEVRKALIAAPLAHAANHTTASAGSAHRPATIARQLWVTLCAEYSGGIFLSRYGDVSVPFVGCGQGAGSAFKNKILAARQHPHAHGADVSLRRRLSRPIPVWR